MRLSVFRGRLLQTPGGRFFCVAGYFKVRERFKNGGGKRAEKIADWSEWKLKLLMALTPLCESKLNRNKLEEYIRSRTVGVPVNSFGDRRERLELQKIQFEIIKRYDGDDAAGEYMEQRLENDDFRTEIIKRSIATKDFDKALKLCLEAESHGSDEEWKELRYKIYVKTGDIDAQKRLAKELLCDGDFDYFAALKALYTPAEWSSELRRPAFLDELGKV
jgi:hypothetical protein